MAVAPAIDPARVIADLRELAERTSDEGGAQRLCWGPGWRRAREYLGELLDELGLEPETDEAGNLWARLEGRDPSEPALALGSHLDSVPGGGWLDGALGVMAALGMLRAWAGGEPPPIPLVLVDWADEEGARFGRSLFGSSAFAGTLEPVEVAGLRDADGRALGDVLAGGGVELARAPRCAARREGLGAYLELHIEQGPVMEAKGLRAAAVTGCAGVERLRLEFRGQAAHAGTTPMGARRDAMLAAADVALAIEKIGRAEGGVATTGELRLEPGIATAVAGRAALSVDLRHPDAEPLARMLEATRAAGAEAGAQRGCEVAEVPVMRIEPVAFDPGLVAAARTACAAAAGEPASLASGALHDAVEVARVLPAAMVFAPSSAGISHAREEDTPEADLAVAIDAFGALAARLLERGI
jgi:N-carbamoyl-L-amino-acid hydrolase